MKLDRQPGCLWIVTCSSCANQAYQDDKPRTEEEAIKEAVRLGFGTLGCEECTPQLIRNALKTKYS